MILVLTESASKKKIVSFASGELQIPDNAQHVHSAMNSSSCLPGAL